MTSEDLTFPGILLLMAVIISIVCTKLIIKNAAKLGLVSEPTERCAHVNPTPSGGGLAFVVSYLAIISLLYSWGYVSGNIILGIGLGGFFIALIGFLDDSLHLSVKVRLLTQTLIITTTLIVFAPLPSIQLFGIELNSLWMSWGLITLLLVWWLNLFNFMDGIDGLASLETLCILVSAIILIGVHRVLSNEGMLIIFLIASLLGFLGYNWAPAKIFMGDAGSTFLGYVLGMIALLTIINGSLNPWAWLILSGVFWVDATITLLRRMLQGERWYQAHQSHTYQRVSRWIELIDGSSNGRSIAHRKVTMTVFVINIFWLFPLAGATLKWPEWGLLILVISWAPLLLLAFYFGAGTQKELAVRSIKR